jgi:TfoX/Sxy family transcriptional regulator of competence genes
MAWKKAPEDLVERFHAALPADARVERRTMFGYPCAFVGGNMFTGTHEHRIIVRLPEEKRRALLAQPGATPFEPMPGRVMREYVVVPGPMLDQPKVLASWLSAAFGYAATLPAKHSRRAPAASAAVKRGKRKRSDRR